LVGAAFLIMGLPFSLIFASEFPSDLVLLLNGQPHEGRVTSSELELSETVNRRHPVKVSFVYDVDNVRYQGQSSSTRRALLALKPDERVSLEVSSLYPAWARVAGTTRAWTGYFGGFVLIFPIIGAGLFLGVQRARRRGIRAYVHGRATVAKIVFTGRDTSIRINGRNPFKVAWEFRAEASDGRGERDGAEGKSYKGSLSSMLSSDLASFTEGTEAIVLYDPGDPGVNTLYL